ncbi:hypothetical protein A9Q86_09905 [Flavobacteriales bacterium 33_180_T64]|nr:hypothetical protein A9Q86_09905 [Flavobacteriales bacterium 33_180_T64]
MVYTIFKVIETDNHYCNSDVTYKSLMLPKEIPSEVRNNLLKKREEALEKKTATKVDRENLYLNPNDWVVILEVDYDLCKTKVAKRIFKFKTTNKKAIDSLIQKQIHTTHAMIENDYISHTILYVGQPYVKEEALFFDSLWSDLKSNILEWLNEDEKEEFKKEYNKAAGIGVRG